MRGDQHRTACDDNRGSVFEECLRAIKEADGMLVIADFGPRNIERLLAFLEIARRTGRRLVVMDKGRTKSPPVGDAQGLMERDGADMWQARMAGLLEGWQENLFPIGQGAANSEIARARGGFQDRNNDRFESVATRR